MSSTVLEHGSYLARFTIDGRQVSGPVELAPLRLPVADLSDDGTSDHCGDFPKQQHADHLVGRLTTNHDIIFYDAQISEYFPGRYTVVARYALAGLGLTAVEDSLSQIELQIEGLDEFIAKPPLGDWTWPKPENLRFEVPLNSLDPITWESDGFIIECEYRWEVNDGKGYQFNASFRPTLTVTCPEPYDVRRWFSDWIVPLFRLMSFDMH